MTQIVGADLGEVSDDFLSHRRSHAQNRQMCLSKSDTEMCQMWTYNLCLHGYVWKWGIPPIIAI